MRTPLFWLRASREAAGGALLLVVRHYPGRVGGRLRFGYYRRRLGGLGEGTRIDEGVHIVNPAHVFIGRNCWIAANAFIGAGPPNVDGRRVMRRSNPQFTGTEGDVHIGDDCYLAPFAIINGHGGVQIGENVAIAAGAKLYSSSHHYRDESGEPGVPAYGPGQRFEAQCLLLGPVVVRDESFVGSNAIVLPAVTIGPRTWLGAGAVAARSLEEGRVYRSPSLEPDP